MRRAEQERDAAIRREREAEMRRGYANTPPGYRGAQGQGRGFEERR